MSQSRPRRIGDQIQQEISLLLARGLKDPRIGFVTVTAVEVTPDLHLARVFYTVLGDEESRRKTQEGLERAVPYLRREIGRALRLRYIPDLLFRFDTSLDYGNRIESILKDLNTPHDDEPEQGDSR